jgi:hypothetical protein
VDYLLIQSSPEIRRDETAGVSHIYCDFIQEDPAAHVRAYQRIEDSIRKIWRDKRHDDMIATEAIAQSATGRPGKFTRKNSNDRYTQLKGEWDLMLSLEDDLQKQKRVSKIIEQSRLFLRIGPTAVTWNGCFRGR